MKGKETRQCISPDNGATQEQVDYGFSNDRNPAGNRDSDADPPVSVGVEPHDLPAECQPERQEQKP
jgi:hypothetical protein